MRVLFLGCGAAARAHSRILRGMKGMDLSYASRDANRAEAYRRAFNGQSSFGSYESAVARDVDVVVVTTPTSSHLDLALLALEAGKAVVVEKPAFMRACDVTVVRATADRLSLPVFVAENYAYKPITGLLRRLITRGDLGDVRFVTLNATKLQRSRDWRADPSLAGGGALFEGGVHWVSFASSIGLEVASVHGYGTAGASSTLVVFRYTNGAVGTLAHSWELAAPFGGLRLSKVQGTEGAVTFESNGFAAFTTGRSRSIMFPAMRDPVGARAMWTDFLRALRTGGPPEFTLAMAERDLRLLEEAGATDIAP